MRFKIGLFIAILLESILITDASALWYSGVWYPGIYGVMAYITTPATALKIFDIPVGSYSGVLNWVSLPPPNWIQTGWNYNYDSTGNLQ